MKKISVHCSIRGIAQWYMRMRLLKELGNIVQDPLLGKLLKVTNLWLRSDLQWDLVPIFCCSHTEALLCKFKI